VICTDSPFAKQLTTPTTTTTTTTTTRLSSSILKNGKAYRQNKPIEIKNINKHARCPQPLLQKGSHLRAAKPMLVICRHEKYAPNL
jgi:hypothetical protein